MGIRTSWPHQHAEHCPDDMELQGEERQLFKARASAGVASKGAERGSLESLLFLQP